jgi:hypothetical protein
MVRIPATLVGLALALALCIGTFELAEWSGLWQLPIALLPLCTALGGFVASRWALRPPPVPGFAVGVLVVAVEVGLGMGQDSRFLAYVDLGLALLQVIAAISGGMVGTLLARRTLRSDPQPEAEYTALS